MQISSAKKSELAILIHADNGKTYRITDLYQLERFVKFLRSYPTPKDADPFVIDWLEKEEIMPD